MITDQTISQIARTRRIPAKQMQWLKVNLEKTLAGTNTVFNWYPRRDIPDVDLECTINDDITLLLNITDRNGMLVINNIQTYFPLTAKNWQVVRKKILRYRRK